jgi:chaperonin GroES
MKLDDRRKKHGIPPNPYLPMGKNVLVFRLPAEEVTAGGIIIADSAKEPKPYGVLVGAGLAALDVMGDHLIELGDIVWFGRFAGWEKEIERDPEGKGKVILQCKIEDILGSVDALDRIKNCTVEKSEDGTHYYEPVKSGRKVA